MLIISINEDGSTTFESNNPSLVREHRNNLLAETDWAAGSDVTMSEEMRNYRQALRDIPQQPDFPNRFTMPNKPE
jgi:hypothetical protein